MAANSLEKPNYSSFQLSLRRNVSAIAALIVSFTLTGGLGSVVIYLGIKNVSHTNSRIDPHIALGRAIAFPIVMLVVHFVGYRLYRRQFAPTCVDGGLAVYRRPMKTALLQQSICLILALLTLDMGQTLNATLIAFLAYWMSAGLIVARRLDSPTRTDLFFVRWSFLVIWLLTVIVGPIVWYRMDY